MKIMRIIIALLLSCVATLKVEFDEDRRDFDLDEFDGRWVAYFGSSRIIKDRRAYLGLRFTLFASILAIFVWSITVDALAGDLRCWLIYLTHQGLLIELCYLGFAAATTAASFYFTNVDGTPGPPVKMPWYCKAAWVLQGVALPGSFLIFVLFWGLVYDGSNATAITPFVHGVNFAIMVADQALSNQPMYLLHAAFFMVFVVAYLAWTVVHYAAGLKDCHNHRYIYAALDWSNPSSAGRIAGAVVVVVAPLVNVAFWSLFFRRAKGPSQKLRGRAAEETSTPHLDAEVQVEA